MSVLHFVLHENTVCSLLMMHFDNGKSKALRLRRFKSCVSCFFFSEVTVPSVIILNTSNEQYFLPSEPTETMEQLVQFISGVLNGSAQVQILSSFLLLLVSAYVFSSV